MKILCEISRPHYHPGPDFDMKVTKKRDLSVPPHWVANERIEKDGQSYAIVMPPREKELYELRQEMHIHLPSYLTVRVNGRDFKVKVKVNEGEFEPRLHVDHIDSETKLINPGDEAIL